MGVSVSIIISLMMVSVAFSRPCHKLNRDAFTVNCEDANLNEFPKMEGFRATTFIFNGNSFRRLTNTTFPPGLAREIQILRNEFPIIIDNSAFSSVSSTLTVLKLQNVEFEFDQLFRPLSGLKALNHLEIGNTRHSRNLMVPFLDEKTLNRLIWLDVTRSGVENVQTEALDSEFKRLRHIGFSFNKLHFIPEGLKHVMNLPQRRSLELDLSHNLLEIVSLDWFSLGCSLTSLNLAYNNINSIHLHALDNCPLLKRLDLQGNFDLLYINPSVFPSNCHLEPHMEIYVQHTGIRNVEFALRSCVGRVVFSNTSVPCTCRHKSLTMCTAAGELIGECSDLNGQYLLISDAWHQWNEEGCYRVEDELYNPQPKPEAGSSLASLKDWGDCQIDDTINNANDDPYIGESQSATPFAAKQPEITVPLTTGTVTSPDLSDHTDVKNPGSTTINASSDLSSGTKSNTLIFKESDINLSIHDVVLNHPSPATSSTIMIDSSESIASEAITFSGHEPTNTESMRPNPSSIVLSSEIPNNEISAHPKGKMIMPGTATVFTESSAPVAPPLEHSSPDGALPEKNGEK